MTRPLTGPALVLVLGLLLSACATGPVYPLMTPIQVAQTFGYDERPLGGNRYEISYVTPAQQALGYRFDTSPTERQAKDLAFDLSTLRAAQLAQQSGWQGFDVVDRHSSADTDYYGGWYGGPWGPGGGWGWHRWHSWGWGGGWGWRGGWGGGPGWDYPPEQRVQAEVTITVAFTNDVKPGQYRAADVIQQVGARYPGVLTPAPVPAPASGPAAQPARPAI